RIVSSRCDLIRCSISQTATRETGSRPVVGSSRKKMRGSCTSPRAISTRRRMPPDRFFTGAARHFVSSTASSSSSISRSRFSRGTLYSFAKMIRFSSTLSSRSLVIACGMTPIDWRTPSACRTMSKPLTSAVPAVGGSSVTSMRISVDLPAPLGPSSPKISPSSTAKVMPFTAVKSPNFLTMDRTSIALVTSRHPEQHVRRHADGEDAVVVVDAQANLERLDVALGPAHVALRRERGVGAAVEHRPLALGARGKAHGDLVADAHAIDVALLDVGANPQIVRVDQRHDRLTRHHHFPDARRADVDDARHRRVNLRVAQPDVGFGPLRGGRRLHVLARLHLAAPQLHLLGVRSRERDGGALGLDLLFEPIELRLRGGGRRA